MLAKATPTLFGLVAGLVGAFVGSRIWSANTVPSTPPSASATVADGETLSLRDARTAGRGLVAAALAAQSVQANRPVTSAASPREQAQQESQKRFERYQNAIAAHWQQPVDDKWAPQARTAIASRLKVIEKANGFSLLDVDCRTNSCVGTIQWQSQDRARAGYRALLYGHYDGVDCASEIHMPTSGDGPFKADLLLSHCR